MSSTLKKIAKDLGLSAVTVSKVLRDYPDISAATKQRVLKRVKELNYHPNAAARSLITGKTWTVGLIVPDLLHPYFAQTANTVSDEMRKHGYGLFIASSQDDPELEREEISKFLARGVDVLMIASVQRTHESFRQIEDQNTPLILIDRSIEGLGADFVGVDDIAVGVLGTAHLIQQGCKQIAHIRGPELSTARGRLDGYRKALADNGMTAFPGYIVSVGASGDYRGDSGGYEATRKLLSNKNRPDGIFCYNDPVAIGAMRAIFEAGLRIPEDVAIVGCGNLFYSQYFRVPLTSVDQHSEEIGKRAAQAALKRAQEKPTKRPTFEIVQPEIVFRASTRRRPT